MNTYTYIGKDDIEIMGYGLVKAGETITVDFEVNHPLFKEKSKKDK